MSVIMDFQHWLWTNVETTVVQSINFNISYENRCWNPLYNINFYKYRYHMVRNIQKNTKTTSSLTKIDVVRFNTTSILTKLMLYGALQHWFLSKSMLFLYFFCIFLLYNIDFYTTSIFVKIDVELCILTSI